MSRPEAPQNHETSEEAELSAATARPESEAGCRHDVLFYEDDDYLIEKLTRYFGEALVSNQGAVIVACETHLQALESRLHDRGIDLEQAISDGRYFRLIVADTLEQIMSGGAPNPSHFFAIFDDVIGRASGELSGTTRDVLVFGELVANLVNNGNPEAAVTLEGLWNELAARRSFDLLCAYPIDAFSSVKDAEALAAICELHTHVTPAESFVQFESDDEQQRAITRLQQRALALENEVARRDQAVSDDQQRYRTGQDQFISVAAHELKTPVSSLRAYAQLLLREGRDAETFDPLRFAAAVGAIEFQTGKLTRLVSNVMETLEIDHGTAQLDLMKIDLADLVRSTLRTEFVDSRHTVDYIGPDRCIVRADPRRIQQVLLNLLDNAAKYSPAGSQIRVVLAQLEDGSARLSVSNEGIGIREDRREAIFERFSRADPESHQSGIGLGLHVARNFVELHGGTLQLDGTSMNGSRFIVTLPQATDRAVIDDVIGTEGSISRVLVVDDDESIRQLIEIVLQDEGFAVDFASDGSAALDVISRQHPDLIMLDMRMPGMDGWEFVERYRARYGHRASIIVFTAAHNAAERSAEVDADGYIAKPFDLDDLIERVTAAVKARGERQ
jgi:signal transduction histidine kinase/ActR/RegA family two-component response regulator